MSRSDLGIRYVDSVETTHFTGALTENSGELESLDFPVDWITLGLGECIIESVTVQSKQNLEWDVWVFSGSDGYSSDLSASKFVDGFNYPLAEGVQIGAVDQYYYLSPANHLSIPYFDEDRSSKIHVLLINRSATAKLAGVTGQVKIRLMVRPVYGI